MSRHQHFDIFCSKAHRQIVQRNNFRIESARILYMRDDIFPPMPGY